MIVSESFTGSCAGLLGLILLSVSMDNCGMAAEPDFPKGMHERAVAELRRALNEEPEFVKIHAAEALLALGYPDGVREVFELEAKKHSHQEIYRVGIWRVLARAGASSKRRKYVTRKLRDIFLDSSAPDRLHAVESLAKLRYQIPPAERADFEAAATSKNSGISLFTNWALSRSYEGPFQQRIAQFLDSEDPIARLRAAYILRYLEKLSDENRGKLKQTAAIEPIDTMTYAYVMGSSFVVANAYRDEEQVARCRSKLYRIAQTGKLREQYAVCEAFAECGVINDVAMLVSVLENAEADARVAAAFALLRIERRVHP